MTTEMENKAEITPQMQLLQGIDPNHLAKNLSNVLGVLDKNRFENSPPAKLIAVTKTVAPAVINQFKALNILDIAENRVQVALPKMTEIAPEFRIHWIGRLQTNKVKYIIDKVCMIHTLDRLSLAKEIDRRAQDAGLIIPTLVQVNIACEPQKSGLAAEEVLPFLRQMHEYPGIKVEGLMSMMPIDASQEELRGFFHAVRTLFDHLREEAVDGVRMQELSMGMSNDFTIAAQEGATMVRIGSALYR